MDITSTSNSKSGITIYRSSKNIIRNSVLAENSFNDIYIDSVGNDEYCNNLIEDITGSGGRPIGYYNSPIDLSDQEYSLLFLCNADDSTLNDIVIRGSDTINNNGLFVANTQNSVFNRITSKENYEGVWITS